MVSYQCFQLIYLSQLCEIFCHVEPACFTNED